MKFPRVVVFLFGYFVNAHCDQFEVRSKITGNACILFDLDATFNLTYTKGGKTENSVFGLNGAKEVNASSQCGNAFLGTTSVLSVSLFPTKERLMFTFKRKNGKVKMSVRFSLQPRKHFKSLNETGTIELNDVTSLSIGKDSPNSYLCYSMEKVAFLSNSTQFLMTMAITNLQVQAYHIKNNKFGPVLECSQDSVSSTSTVGPHYETTMLSNTTTEPPTETTTHSQTETTTEPHSNTTTEPPTETTTHSQTETTTEPHSNTTTEPPMGTTTHHEPETTTKPHSNTTTEPPTGTTTHHEPETTTIPTNESTTSAHVETSTAPEIETTTKLTPTSSVSPPVPYRYVVRDNKEVCIVLQGDIQFEIPYLRTDGTTATRNVTIPKEVKVTGTCKFNGTDSAQEITLTFFNTSWALDIVIAKEKRTTHKKHMLLGSVYDGSDEYAWQQFRLSYVLDANFPNSKHPGEKIQAVADGAFGKFKANMDGSYKCNAEQELEFQNDKMKMDLTKMQYKAFGKTNSTEFPNTGVSECPADSNSNKNGGGHKTLGIALGCSLAGLVVIVIGACFVVRYRRKKAESVSYDSIQ